MFTGNGAGGFEKSLTGQIVILNIRFARTATIGESFVFG
jgi:hypothetical protein